MCFIGLVVHTKNLASRCAHRRSHLKTPRSGTPCGRLHGRLLSRAPQAELQSGASNFTLSQHAPLRAHVTRPIIVRLEEETFKFLMTQ